MDLGRFKAGDVLHLHDGSRVEALAPSDDGRSVRVRYLDAPGDAELAGTEDFVAAERIAAFTPAPPGPEWAGRLTVVVHHVPESEDGEAGYGAVTMGGTPLGVSVEASDADSAPEALDRLLGALRVLGFVGSVQVEDATYLGGIQRYEMEVGGDETQ